MMKKQILLLLALAGFFTLVACGPAGPSADSQNITYTEYHSEMAGITFQYPENWTIEETPDSIDIASRAELMEASAITDGSGVSISTAPTSFLNTGDLLQLLGQATNSFAQKEGSEVIQEPTTFNANNQEAVTTIIRGTDKTGTETVLQYTVIAGKTRAAYIISFTDPNREAEFTPILNAIINSIELTESTE